MALTEWVPCVVLSITVLVNGYQFASLTDEQQQLTNYGPSPQGAENPYKQNEENPPQPVDLQSIFGKDWETENIPLQQDELDSALLQIFGKFITNSKNANVNASSAQSFLKSNDDKIEKNTPLSGTDVNQYGAPWQSSQEAKGDSNYDSTISTERDFPFHIVKGQYVPYTEGKDTAESSTTSSYEPEAQTGIYGSATPNSENGILLGNLNPTLYSAPVASNINPTDGVSSATPSWLPETQTEAKPDIPDQSFDASNAFNPTPSSNSESQDGLSSRFGYNYQSVQNSRPYFWPVYHGPPFWPHGYHPQHGHNFHPTPYWSNYNRYQPNWLPVPVVAPTYGYYDHRQRLRYRPRHYRPRHETFVYL